MNENGHGADSGLSLPPVTDLSAVAGLKARLEQALAAGEALAVDAAAVQRISSPCLEVLIAGRNAFAKAGGPSMTIANPSAAFLETAATLGLADMLGLIGMPS